MSYITVIGGGSWGTTLAALLADKGYDTTLWMRNPELAAKTEESRINESYLPGVKLPNTLMVTSSLSGAIDHSRFIVNAVPTQYVREVFKEVTPLLRQDAIIVSASKGIEHDTFLTVSGIIGELTGRSVAALSGPSFAAEVSLHKPTAVTLASKSYDSALMLQEIFKTDYFRVYTHDDVMGTELGGALKNVIAVASGICDKLELGNNARAALITRGMQEITRLGLCLGAKENTFSGLSGIGDLVLTCSSTMSRNYSVGQQLAAGKTITEITSSTRSVAEGVATARSAHELSQKRNIDLPIVSEVHSVIYEGKSAAQAVYDLMTRPPKSEFDG